MIRAKASCVNGQTVCLVGPSQKLTYMTYSNCQLQLARHGMTPDHDQQCG